MWRILFIALFSSAAFGQAIDTGDGSNGACTSATIASGTGTDNGSTITYNCTTLTVSTTPNFPAGSSALVIKVQGQVLINAPLNLTGGNGSYSGSATGGLAGPGAGDGGAYFLGGNPAPGIGGGINGVNSGSCGGGGGAGSFISLGENGVACPSGSAGGGVGTTYDPFVSAFRGGFGGGSGGEGPPGEAGSGGGGGGALHIMAGGNVEINANISARGGEGGSATGAQVGGPGGGGSGGVIWIQTLGQITNNGQIEVTGGSGGTSPQGHRGGNGGNGVFKLEDADGVISGTGSGASGSSSKLTSSISCGTLKLNDRDTLPQLMLGFSLIALLQFFGRGLKRLRNSEAKA